MSGQRRDGTAVRGWRKGKFARRYILGGLIVLICVACIPSVAGADVDMTGKIAPGPALKSGLSLPGLGAEPLVNSEHDGVYHCSDAYSTIANVAGGLAIGNCPKNEEFDVEDYGSGGESGYFYGGYFANVGACAWVKISEALKEKSGNLGHCSGGIGYEYGTFYSKINTESPPYDGFYVNNRVACEEYANVYPWSADKAAGPIRNVLPYTESHENKGYPALKWRYVTNNGKYVMVRDTTVGGGEGNWVFVERSCLPATLPPANEELSHPPKPSNAWALVRPNEELDAFYAGTNSVMHDAFAGSAWTIAEFPPASGYPAAAGYPSAFVRSNGELNAYYRGTNNYIYQLFANTAWHVENLGCCSAGDPVAFERANGELQAFFRGTNNGIYNDWWVPPSGKWSSQRLGGTSEMLGKPSGFERANGEIQIFFRGTDNGIYNLWYGNGKWSVQKLGCCSAGNPAAMERSNGEIDVFFRGTNNDIEDIWYSGGVWNPPAALATEAAGNPTAFSRVNGEIQLFYRARQTGAIWNGWAQLGAKEWSFVERACCAAGDPTALEQPSGALRVFFRGTNNALYDSLYYSGTWHSPEYIGGEAAEDSEY